MRNRTEGHNWERRCVNLLKHIFPFMVTSRSESRSRDDMKIDLMNNNEYENGVIPYEFQCKSTASNLNYHKIFQSMPGVYPKVILHKKTEKKGKRFFEQGTYAILELDEFIKLLNGNKRTDRDGPASSKPVSFKKDFRRIP